MNIETTLQRTKFLKMLVQKALDATEDPNEADFMHNVLDDLNNAIAEEKHK